MRIEELVRTAAGLGASDIHIVAGLPPKMRHNGRIQAISAQPLSREDCAGLARELAGEAFESVAEIGELDRGATIAGMRVRVNLFRQQGSFSAALRILSEKIPPLESLGLPPAVLRFPEFRQGIVLVTGETGSGKSTTLAAILQRINESRQEHILTLEDPIEYVYTPAESIVNQRQIGTDTRSYADGLRAALREDPDVLLIGEMRDFETIETALTAAETGHLVFATLHTNSAVDAVDRIVGVFPEARQPQIRLQLSTTLRAVLSQQLLPELRGQGRVLAAELLIMNPALANLIREGKTQQMYSFLLSGAKDGSVTMDNCLLELLRSRRISSDTALAACFDRESLRKRML